MLFEAVARAVGTDPLELSRRVGHDVAFASAGRVGRTVISIFGEHMSGFRLREATRTACVSEGDSSCRFELRFEQS